jgi:L-alanine-DL-glutamate epimerase-like enolase superfamily enzyme
MTGPVKITDVEAIYLRSPDLDQRRTDSSQDALLVRVSTDAGIVGYGEVDSAPLVAKAVIEAPPSHTIARGLRELLIGEDARDIERLWQLMYDSTLYYGRGGVAIHAMAGVDIALWDIRGQLAGEPIHRLLGEVHRSEMRAYASNMFGLTVEETAARARRAREDGFTGVKFGWEPFGKDPRTDERLVCAIRDEVGPTVDVMIDAGLAWNADTTLERLRMLERYDVFWLEEPLPPDDYDGYRRVTSSTSTWIAAGEEESTIDGFRRLMDEAGVDVVQVDVTRTGLTQAIKIAALAHERGLQCANHTFTTDVNVAASLHFLAAIPNAIYLEYCVEKGDIRSQLAVEPFRVIDGVVRVPQKPGLGVDLNPMVIERYASDR